MCARAYTQITASGNDSSRSRPAGTPWRGSPRRDDFVIRYVLPPLARSYLDAEIVRVRAASRGRGSHALGIALLIAAASLRCATTGATTAHDPTLTWEQHTLRIPLTVEAQGTVSFAERPP